MPSFINIDQFAEARSHELSHFTKNMKTKLSSKLAHQMLPKHMRRRAMAHNHYQIPVRIRLQALKDLSGSEKPGELKRSKCRRHRRKLRYLLHLYEIRQRRHRWMETHVWHAKRFKMINMHWNGGCRVPLNCNDKSTRCIYKLCQKESACIADLSYYSHIWIKKDALDKILKHEDVQYSIKVERGCGQNYREELKIFERSKDGDRILLALVDLIVLNSAAKYIMIIHPSVTQEVVLTLEKIVGQPLDYFGEIKWTNDMKIIAKNISLHHFYNVLQPIAAPDSQNLFNAIERCNFSDSLLSEGQAVVFNVDRAKL